MMIQGSFNEECLAMPISLPEQHNPQHLPLRTPFGKRRLTGLQLEQLQFITLAHPILVTDDDMMSRALHRAILDQYALRMIETRTSADALSICQTQSVSLVISDIMKPHMDGLEMLRHLRADSQTEHIPLIFVTATAGTQDTAFQLGADSFIRKPFHPNELLWEVWRLLSKRIK
jgi:CheY-like chemotaxis protein